MPNCIFICDIERRWKAVSTEIWYNWTGPTLHIYATPSDQPTKLVIQGIKECPATNSLLSSLPVDVAIPRKTHHTQNTHYTCKGNQLVVTVDSNTQAAFGLHIQITDLAIF